MPFGAKPTKLMPWEGGYMCDTHMREALDWYEVRPSVINAVESFVTMDTQVRALVKKTGYMVKPVKTITKSWVAYIYECAEFAGIALDHDDRRTFVYYFSRAMYAHTLEALSHANP